MAMTTPPCSQSQFDSIFCNTLDLELDRNGAVSRKPGVDSFFAMVKRTSLTVSLFGKLAEGLLLKKEKRVVEAINRDGKDSGRERNKVDVCTEEVNSGGCGGRRNFSLAVVVKGGAVNNHHHYKAKHMWKKQVWVVLLLDLFVCMALFVIWL